MFSVRSLDGCPVIFVVVFLLGDLGGLGERFFFFVVTGDAKATPGHARSGSIKRSTLASTPATVYLRRPEPAAPARVSPLLAAGDMMNRTMLPIILLGVLEITGCTTTKVAEPQVVDIFTLPKESRVAIMPVAWVQKDMGKVFAMQGDSKLSYIMIATLDEYLNERQVPAYFIGATTGVVDDATSKIVQTFDRTMLVTNAPAGVISESLRGLSPEFRDKVPRMLVPVAVYEKINAAIRILFSPGGFGIAYHAYLIDTTTGAVTWSNSIQCGGNYNAVDLDLRGTRWGHGAMWKLIETYPGASAPDKNR